MDNFKLQPADILVNVNRRRDPISTVKRWAAGPYEHVFMYTGKVGLLLDQGAHEVLRFPMLYESNGRGVVIQNLSNRYGQEVVVLRLKSEYDKRRIPRVLEEAIKLASDPRSHYDYLCIVKYILPRLICEKLGLPMPLKYQKDPWHICTEAVNEVFIQGGLHLLYLDEVPLPGDFVEESLSLEQVWGGTLSEDLASLL